VPIPDKDKKPPEGDTEPLGKVGCDEWLGGLGGLLKHYYRQAA